MNSGPLMLERSDWRCPLIDALCAAVERGLQARLQKPVDLSDCRVFPAGDPMTEELRQRLHDRARQHRDYLASKMAGTLPVRKWDKPIKQKRWWKAKKTPILAKIAADNAAR